MPWLAAVAPIIGGIIGNQTSQGAADSQRAAYEKALAAYSGINLPNIEDMKLDLEQLQSSGTLTPQLEEALGLGPSASEGIALNPEMRAKQMEAMQMVADRATQGYNAQDRMAMDLNLTGALGAGQAANSRDLQNLQSRGMGGSGNELISKLNNNQNSAEMARRQGVEQAMASQQAKMSAAQQYGNMASGLRGQDFGEQAHVAQAKDLIARINQQNAQSVQQRNVGSQNQAQQYNLQNNQNIANQNVGLRNQQQMFNRNLPQQQFQNQMAKAGGTAGQQGNMGQYFGNQAANTQSMWSGIGKGIGGAAAGYNQMQNNNRLNDAQIGWYQANSPKMSIQPNGMEDPQFNQYMSDNYGQ